MRCRMRCGDIWRCGGPIKKHVPVESVSIGDWDSSITFEGQLEPYDVTYSINVSPEDASNKDVTITTSDASVISVVSYDSTSVTFSIAGSGNATVTVVSQDNADILATYSVEVTPAETPFSPNNNILVEPTRGSARVKFFPVDENDENYVYGEVSDTRNLVSIAYYGNCDNELCRGLFSNSGVKKELAKQISNYIDDYGIPASGAFEFSPETWVVFESYFNGEANASDVRMAIRENGLKPADSCPVTIAGIATDEVAVQFGGTATIDFTVSYDCAAPDYSNLYARSDNTAVCSVEIREADGYLKVFSHANYGECTLTFGDGTTEYTIPVTVPRPALESITIDTGGETEIEVGNTANFSVNLSPEGAIANIVPYGMYTEGVDANVTYTDGGGLDVEALAISNIEVGVEDTITGIQSGAVEFSLVEAQPHIEFDVWYEEPNVGEGRMDYYPCRHGDDCWCFDDECQSTGNGFFSAVGYIVSNLGDGFIEFQPKDITEGVDPNSFTFSIEDYREDQDYWGDFVVTISYDGDLCNDLPTDEYGGYTTIGTIAAIYKENEFDEGTEIGVLTLTPQNFDGCNGDGGGPLELYTDLYGLTTKPTIDGGATTGSAFFEIYLNQDDPLYDAIINDPEGEGHIDVMRDSNEIDVPCDLPQIEYSEEMGLYFFPYEIFSGEELTANLIFTFSDGRQQSRPVNISTNNSNALYNAFRDAYDDATLREFCANMQPGSYEQLNVPTDLGKTFNFRIRDDGAGYNIDVSSEEGDGCPYEYYAYTVFLNETPYSMSQNSSNGTCYM